MFLTLEVIEVNAEIFQQEKKMIFYNCFRTKSTHMLTDCFTFYI